MVASARLPAEAEASKAAAASISVVPGGAADLGRKLEERVTDFSLPNGLRFIVAERHAAPTVACRTYADVGAFDEADGSTGIAHLLGGAAAPDPRLLTSALLTACQPKPEPTSRSSMHDERRYESNALRHRLCDGF